MNFDQILIRCIGEFGVYQGLILALSFLCAFPVGWHILVYIFISGTTQNYWCQLPAEGFGNATRDTLKDIFIPSEIKNGQRVFESCEMYALDTTNISETIFNRLRHGDFINGSDVRENMTARRRCSSWEYDQDGRFYTSVLSQYDLTCEKEWLIPLTQVCIMAGWLVGNFLFGSLADRFGRMKVIPIGFLMTTVIGVVMPFMPNYYAFLLFRFLIGVTAGGPYTIIFVLIMEVCGLKHRPFFGILFGVGFNTAVISISGVAYAMAPINHTTVQIIIGCLPIIIVLSRFVIYESPRWLAAHQKYDEARSIIKKIAKLNGRPLAEDAAITFPDENLLPNGKAESLTSKPVRKYTAIDLFRTPNLRRTTLASYVVWFASAMIFYGLVFIGGSLGANVYINTVITGANGVVGSFMTVPFLNYLGRRTTCVGALAIMTASMVASVFLIGRPEYETALIVVVFIGKFCNVMSFDSIYVHAAEMFPTCVRSLGVGTGSLCARVGALLSPIIAKTASISPVFPVIVFSAVGGIATIVAILLPETKGRHLTETIQEGEEFTRLNLACPWIRLKKMTDISTDNDEDSSEKQDQERITTV